MSTEEMNIREKIEHILREADEPMHRNDVAAVAEEAFGLTRTQAMNALYGIINKKDTIKKAGKGVYQYNWDSLDEQARQDGSDEIVQDLKERTESQLSSFMLVMRDGDKILLQDADGEYWLASRLS